MSKQTTPAVDIKPVVDIDAILADSVRRKPGGTCTVCSALASMPDDWRAKFAAAINDLERYSATSLIAALERIGISVGRGAVERHRRRECMGNRGHA